MTLCAHYRTNDQRKTRGSQFSPSTFNEFWDGTHIRLEWQALDCLRHLTALIHTHAHTHIITYFARICEWMQVSVKVWGLCGSWSLVIIQMLQLTEPTHVAIFMVLKAIRERKTNLEKDTKIELQYLRIHCWVTSHYIIYTIERSKQTNL